MAPARILVVEDEGIVSIDLRNILNRLGYQVAGTAFTGEEAILKARECSPDLILMDIGLKGQIDGITAAQIIRRDRKIPVVFLTGYADNLTIQRANEVDPSGYILKPVNEDELLMSLAEALD
jgi:CheY-like chemotaxis protein